MLAIYEVTSQDIRRIERTTFRASQIHERADLQRLLRDRIDIIAPDCLVIAEEFGDWDDSRRRIDLLAIDTDANLVVIELKRTEDGGHMDLQALRYASMVSTMTFSQAVLAHERFLAKTGRGDEDASANILKFLGWDTPDENAFSQDVRIVLASAEFSLELTSAVLWLNNRGLDIRCVRLIPHSYEERVLLDVQQMIPLPEAESYQVRVREKSQKERESRLSSRELTKYTVTLNGETLGPLSKRETVLRIIKHLCKSGASPLDIQQRVTNRKTNSFVAARGSFVSEGDFIRAMDAIKSAEGRRFDAQRWYVGDDERIEFDGHTFAVSNQWGLEGVEWLNEVLNEFPGHAIEFKAADGD